MMKRWWHYLLLGVFAWLLFLAWRLPATVAYGLVEESLGHQVKLAGIQGTVWDGGAQLQYQNKAVGESDWELSPWGLLLGRINGNFSIHELDSALDAQLRLPIGGGELMFSDIRGRVALARIQPYLSMLPLPLEGELSLKLERLVVSDKGRVQQADGRVVWHQAAVQVMDKLSLGDLQMILHSVEGGGIEGTISDSGGPLQLNAILTLGDDGSYQLNGKARPNDSAPKSLRDSLAMLGRPDSQGGYPLNYSGKL